MKGAIAQEWANRLKTIRTAIRLRHAIAADNELNQVIDVERKKFYAQAMKGQLAAPLDVKKVVKGA